jgi:uncharacterized protein YjbI with pentapeptide repeats
MNGALRKCRLSGADLSEANLQGVNLGDWKINADTNFEGVNFKKTLVAGKEEMLRNVARRNS